MSLFLWLVFIQLVIFAILIAFLRIILTKNISKATSHINELNQDYSQKLEDAQKRTLEADKYYDSMLLKAKTEAEKTKMQILKEANDSQQLIVNHSRKISEEILEKAMKSKAALLEEVGQKISDGAIKSACEIIQEILPDLMTKEMHEHWVDELLKHGLEELDRLNLPPDLVEVKIDSAFELTAHQKTILEKKVKEKLGHETQFIHKIDAELIAGLKMVLGSVVIDGSLKFKIMEVARHV